MAASTIIRTNSGLFIDILNPDPAMICIEDIAHSLSHQCRFNGHTDQFYSVAQHCVVMAVLYHTPESLRLTALLHDAAEAYLGDVVSPIKHLLHDYHALEDHMNYIIAEAFGLQYPFDPIIDQLDQFMLEEEFKLYFDNGKGICWPADIAKHLYIDTFLKLAKG
jgi:5'-deoxynucleotidase YfbR-like HD superfamily hydrolase